MRTPHGRDVGGELAKAAREADIPSQGEPGQWHVRQRCPVDERLVSRVLPLRRCPAVVFKGLPGLRQGRLQIRLRPVNAGCKGV